MVHPRHFGGFTAHQRTTGLLTPAGDTGHHAGRNIDIQFAGRVIVEEIQRLSPLHENVIDAHRHQVNPDRVMPVQLDRKPQLGPHAVCPGNENRLPVTGRQLEQCPEAANAAENARTMRRPGQRLEPVDQPVAGDDIDA